MLKPLIKSIYKLVPFKKQLFTLLKMVWKPSKSMYQHLHFHGTISVPLNSSQRIKMKHHGFELENELFWVGIQNGWEKYSINLWMKLCKEANCIVDVGANTGVYALVAKALQPSANVYAFEPVARVYEKLLENVKLNNMSIYCSDKALSNDNGSAVIYDDLESAHTYSVTVNKNTNPSNTKALAYTIAIQRLDTFIEEQGISNIDLMKIDVEMHEPEVLEGFGIYLEKFQPTLLIEILTKEVADKVSLLVKDIPYLYFNIHEDTGIRQVDAITQSDYYNFLFCKKDVAKKFSLIA